MAEQKTYKIHIDGIEQSVKGVESLGDAVKGTTKTFDDYAKVVDKLQQYKDAYAKLEESAFKKEIKNQYELKKARETVAAGMGKTYAEQQKYLTALGKVIKNTEGDVSEFIKEYNALNDKLKQVDATMGNHQRNVGNYASAVNGLNKPFSGVISLAKGAVSAFQLYNGVMTAFGANTEEAAEIMKKLMSTMSIIQSLNELNNSLKEGSVVSKLFAKAMNMMSVSMEGATTATKALKVALASIGIGLVIVAITELITHWEDLKEAIGMTTKEQEKANKVMKDASDAYIKAKVEMEALTTKLNTFNGTKAQEKQLVEDLNKKYGDAFGKYKTLAEWKQALKKKTDAYCESLAKEAEIQSLINELEEIYRKQRDKQKEADEGGSGWNQFLDDIMPWTEPNAVEKSQKEAEKLGKQADQIKTKIKEVMAEKHKAEEEGGLWEGITEPGTDKKGGKGGKHELTEEERAKLIAEQWEKAQLKAANVVAQYKKELDKEEAKRLKEKEEEQKKIAKAEKEYDTIDYNINKKILEIELDKADTEEKKIGLKKKLIYLEAEYQKKQLKQNTAATLGISEEELDQMLNGVRVMTDYQAQVISNMQLGMNLINLGVEQALGQLEGNGKKDENGFAKWFNDELTQASIELAQEAFDTIADGFISMMDLEVEEAQEALDEITEMHEEQVEKVNESQEKIAELNQKMRDASGSQLEQYKQQMADERQLLEQREQEEKRLQKEKEKRQAELEKQEKKRKKAEAAAQIVQAAINVALGVTKAISSFAPPANFVFAALVSALGLAQLAIMTKNYQKMADGGLLSGKSHAQGGIPVGNTGVEVEGGEYVVNKRSTAKYLPLLQQINEEGARKKTVANQIGKYADGGQLNYERINSNLDALNTAKIVSSAIEGIEMHPVVSVVDINRGQRNYTEVRQLAGANS